MLVAIERLPLDIAKTIKKFQKKSNLVSSILLKAFPLSDEKSFSKSDIDRIFISKNSIDNLIISRFSELAEICFKSLGKNEIYIVEVYLNSFTIIISDYLTFRKNNILFYPSSVAKYLVSESDADKVINKSYEILFSIAQKSNQLSNQILAIECLRAISNIAISINQNIVNSEKPQPSLALRSDNSSLLAS
ncbi:MAG: hypothetical protein KKD86_01280 [Bacteroidetes bacterium]|nr:hypothetical protein [Bacteroidota bacterium]